MLSTVCWILIRGLLQLIGSWVEIPEIVYVAAIVAGFIVSELVWHGRTKLAVIGCVRKGILVGIAVIVSTLLGGEWNFNTFEYMLVGMSVCNDVEGFLEFKEFMKSNNS